MDKKNDIWEKLNAQIEAHEQREKSIVQKRAEITDAIMKTFDIFQASLNDYVQIAQHYHVKRSELVFFNKIRFISKNQRICVPAYELGLTYSENYSKIFRMYLSDNGKLLLGYQDRDRNGYLNDYISGFDFTPLYITILERKIYDSLDSHELNFMPFPEGVNYIYGELSEALIRLTYNFSAVESKGIYGSVYHCDFQWDKPRSKEEIRDLIQEFFVSSIRKSRIKN